MRPPLGSLPMKIQALALIPITSFFSWHFAK
jgi:hypothetical protein